MTVSLKLNRFDGCAAVDAADGVAGVRTLEVNLAASRCCRKTVREMHPKKDFRKGFSEHDIELLKQKEFF